MTTVQELAQQAAECFEVAKRQDGDELFFRVKDGSPEWVTDVVRSAHGEFLPDDWRYRIICEAFGFIAENENAEDESAEFADTAVDVYTGQRFAWLASNLQRQGYVDDALAELGWDGDSAADLIGLGQYQEAGEVFALVLQALEALAS